MPFANQILGGQSTLIRPAIKSPNFVTKVSGWTINKDGSAEFNNLTIRGTFLGTDFILNSSGFFIYSGAAALGNLILSETPVTSSGTDQFGNAYLGGSVTYQQGSPGFNSFALANSGGGLTWYTATSSAGPWTSFASLGFTYDNVSHTGNIETPGAFDVGGGLAVTGGTVTDSLTVNGHAVTVGNAVTFPATEPTGASAAPTSYNQTWGATVVNAIDNLIINLRNNGILN